MALLGEGFNPQIGLLDFSGIAQAGRERGNAISNIGGMIEDYAKMRKDQKDKVKGSKEKIEAAMKLFGPDAEFLSGALDQIQNEDIPISERAAVASQADDMISLGIEKMKAHQKSAMDSRVLAIDEGRLNLATREYEEAPQRELAKYDAVAGSKNDADMNDAITIAAGLSDITGQLGEKAPMAPELQKRLEEAVAAGQGSKAKSVAEEMKSLLAPQINDLLKPVGGEIKTLDIPLPDGNLGKAIYIQTRDGPVNPNGTPFDIEGMLTPPDGIEPAALPVSGDLPAGTSTPSGNSLLPPRSGAVVMQTPKDPLAAQKSALEVQKLQGDVDSRTADTAKQTDMKASARSSAESAIDLIGKLRTHPGFPDAVGVSMVPGFLPATDRKGAEAIINQLKGQAFLNAIQQLRGLGALSDAEGKKLGEAAARLDAGQSEKDFKLALDDYEKIVKDAVGRLGGPAAPAQPAETSALDRLNRLRGVR